MPFQTRTEHKDRVAFSDILDSFAQERANKQPLTLKQVPGGHDVLDVHSSGLLGRKKADTAEQRAAFDLIKQAMDQQLGPGTADRLFREAGMEDREHITLGELQAVGQSFNQVQDAFRQQAADLTRPSLQTWTAAAATGVPGASRGAVQNLEDLLANETVTWNVSQSGSGGTLIARLPDGTGAVVKIESQEAVTKAGLLSQVLNQAYGAGGGVYEVATVTNESSNDAAKTALQQKVAEMRQQAGLPSNAADFLDKHTAALSRQDVGIGKMNFVAGIQLNNLPLDDKMALLQSGQLAKELGKAAVICPMVGLADHASASTDYYIVPTNLSNFLVDPATAKLTPIDFDTKDLPGGRYGVNGSGEGVKALTDLVERATLSQADFDRVVTTMVNEYKEGGNRTPLCATMNSLNPNGEHEGLFSTPQGRAVGPLLTDELLRQQAIEMLKGTIDGLEYLQQNENHIRTGMAAIPNAGQPADQDKAFAAVAGKDFAAMRQNVTSLAEGRGLAVVPPAALAPPAPAPAPAPLVLDANPAWIERRLHATGERQATLGSRPAPPVPAPPAADADAAMPLHLDPAVAAQLELTAGEALGRREGRLSETRTPRPAGDLDGEPEATEIDAPDGLDEDGIAALGDDEAALDAPDVGVEPAATAPEVPTTGEMFRRPRSNAVANTSGLRHG